MAMTESNTSKAIKGMSSQTLVTIILGVVEVVSFSLMSRLLSREDFGYYAAITAVVTVFACLSDAGIGSAIIQKKEASQSFINNAFSLGLWFGAAASLLLFSFAGVIARLVADSSMTVPLRIMSVTLLLNCLNSINISIMYKRLQFLRVGLINLISSVVTTVVAVYLAWKGFGYYAIITKAVLTSVICVVLSYLMAHTKYRIVVEMQTYKEIFCFSGWLMASSIFRNVAAQIDRLTMPRLLSVASLGAYNRPKDFLHQVSTRLNSIFDTALFPVLSGIQDDKKRLGNSYRQSLYAINVFAMFLAFSVIVNSELIIRIFFGSEWLSLKALTQVLALVLVFNIDGRLADCYLRSLGKTRDQFNFRIVETITNLSAVLIGYHWDVMGVAVAMLIATSSIKICKILFVTRYMDLSKWDSIKIIVSSWKFMIVLLPLSITTYRLLPNTWGGNIVLLIIYLALSGTLFLCFPSLVGKHYKDAIYTRAIAFIKIKIHK